MEDVNVMTAGAADEDVQTIGERYMEIGETASAQGYVVFS